MRLTFATVQSRPGTIPAPNRCLHQNYQTKQNRSKLPTAGCSVPHHCLKRPSVTVFPASDLEKSQFLFALEWPCTRLENPLFSQQS